MTQLTCAIDGCTDCVRARGWCAKHYKRWRSHGDPHVNLYELPKPACSIDGCSRPVAGNGWCALHYQRWQRHGDPLKTTRTPPGQFTNIACRADCCERPTKALGLCHMHYARWTRHATLDVRLRVRLPGQLCSIEGCPNRAECRTWCDMHYSRWQAHGDPTVTLVSPISIRCSRDGCERRAAKAGLCWTCYRRICAEFRRAQGSRCAICEIHEAEAPGGHLGLDHDHETGEPRAMLCHHCNVGLGHFGDDPNRLAVAARYLGAHGKTTVTTRFPSESSSNFVIGYDT